MIDLCFHERTLIFLIFTPYSLPYNKNNSFTVACHDGHLLDTIAIVNILSLNLQYADVAFVFVSML